MGSNASSDEEKQDTPSESFHLQYMSGLLHHGAKDRVRRYQSCLYNTYAAPIIKYRCDGVLTTKAQSSSSNGKCVYYAITLRF